PAATPLNDPTTFALGGVFFLKEKLYGRGRFKPTEPAAAGTGGIRYQRREHRGGASGDLRCGQWLERRARSAICRWRGGSDVQSYRDHQRRDLHGNPPQPISCDGNHEQSRRRRVTPVDRIIPSRREVTCDM